MARHVLVVLAVATLPAAIARADGESALSGSLGWATYSVPGKDNKDVTPTIGGALAIEYERSFAEPLSWRVELAGGVFKGDGTSWMALGDAGVAYRFDVLKYVPYGFAGIGAVMTGGGPLDRHTAPVLVLGGGLDVLSSRDRSWGLEGRLSSFAGSVTTFSVSARLTLRWGYF